MGASRLREWLAAKLSAHASDPLLVDFLAQIGRWLLTGLGLVPALNLLGMNQLVSGVLAGLGLSAFVVGFHLQGRCRELPGRHPGGVFKRPFSIDDTSRIKDMFG